MCPDGTIPYVGMDFVPDVTYLFSLGIVFWWDHSLCWHCVQRGSCLMLDFVPDVTYFLWALCPGGTIPYVGIVF